MSNITAVSFSRVSSYRTCPQKAKFSIIDKLQEPSNTAMERGSTIHKKFEQYIKVQDKKVTAPEEYGEYTKEIEKIKKSYTCYTEIQLALNKKLARTDWFGADAYIRSILDLFYLISDDHAKVVDYKTGKPKTDHIDQMEIYAFTVFHAYPKVNTLDVEFWYVDHGIEHKQSHTFVRADVKKITSKWTKIFNAVTKDESFVPKVGSHCRWCYFRKSNGGPCQHS